MTARKLILLASALVTAVAVAGVSYASIPGSDGVITACKDAKGTLRVIDAEAGQTCSSNQQPLSWNQQGQPGPAGAPGVGGYERVTLDGEMGMTSHRGA